MLNAKRMSDRSSSVAQSLLTFSIVAVLAFSLGLLVGPLSRQVAETPVDRTSEAAPTIGTKPIAAARNETTLVRVPYEAGWELYDGGWAGGPAYTVPALVRVPYEMGWELYDGGWAGGPPTILANGTPARMATLSPKLITTIHARATSPFSAMYDGGWAGGPPTFAAATAAK